MRALLPETRQADILTSPRRRGSELPPESPKPLEV